MAGEWCSGTNPQTHIEAIDKLFRSGVSVVNVHVAQNDQKRAIGFYQAEVLPDFAQRAS
ncbi:hypothetical protein [Enhydrobacter sp.]|uniref:hypothetical protein n=1 Tax=Enhydrobacter sp. TaxID=1894999 RepID=UPI002633AD13|nr:hypothetical protein [Enhydrobacter sp.]WIM13194.1 MAG: hypothetical protein OJF58_004160 [Enhydrobacter sp.]